MLKYLVLIVTGLYAVLSIWAAGSQVRIEEKRNTALLMIFGGALLLLAVGLEATAWFEGWLIAALGGVCICVSAFLNGRRSGNFHPKHHMIRFVVTLLLIVGFYML